MMPHGVIGPHEWHTICSSFIYSYLEFVYPGRIVLGTDMGKQARLNINHIHMCWICLEKHEHLFAFHTFHIIPLHWNGIGIKFFLLEFKGLPMSHCQRHGCWWPGDEGSQGISSHGVDPVSLEYSKPCTVRVKFFIHYICTWQVQFSATSIPRPRHVNKSYQLWLPMTFNVLEKHICGPVSEWLTHWSLALFHIALCKMFVDNYVLILCMNENILS